MGLNYMLFMFRYFITPNLTDIFVNTYNDLSNGCRDASGFQLTYFYCLHSSDKMRILKPKRNRREDKSWKPSKHFKMYTLLRRERIFVVLACLQDAGGGGGSGSSRPSPPARGGGSRVCCPPGGRAAKRREGEWLVSMEAPVTLNNNR